MKNYQYLRLFTHNWRNMEVSYKKNIHKKKSLISKYSFRGTKMSAHILIFKKKEKYL